MIKSYTSNGAPPQPPDRTMLKTRAEAVAEAISRSGERGSLVVNLATMEALHSHRLDMIFNEGGKMSVERWKNLIPEGFFRLNWEEYMRAMLKYSQEVGVEYFNGASMGFSYPVNIAFPDFWGSEQVTLVRQTGELFLLQHDDGQTAHSPGIILYLESSAGHLPGSYHHMTPVIKKNGIIQGETNRLAQLAADQIKEKLPFTDKQLLILSKLPNRQNATSIRTKFNISQGTYGDHLKEIGRIAREDLGLEISASELAVKLRALNLC